jgi:hypothetical protein
MGHFARGPSKEQARSAFNKFQLADVLFRDIYEKLQATRRYFRPRPTGKAQRASRAPKISRGLNLPTLVSWHEPAAASAMVGITDLLAKCKLLAVEARDPSAMVQEHLG